jgi:branched-chain amino acid transport system substrate-binding protein
MNRQGAWIAALAAACLLGPALPAAAAEPLKIGLVLPMSGPFAQYGKQIERGARLYLAQHGDNFSGRKVELVIKDDTGVAPEVSKRVSQELVVQDKVDLLAGYGLTPSAMASAAVATESKKAMIILNAATSSVTTKSNYIVRVSMTLPQNTAPIASWAAKNGIRTVYTVCADYGPGHDAEETFKKTFTAAGGQVVGEVRTPVKNPDFSPYLQKVKDTHPDAVFLFIPAGEQGVAFMKGFSERDLGKAGIRLIATGDLTVETDIDAIGDPALGVITSFHYSEAHNSPENKAFTEAWYKAYGPDRPGFMAVAGYDGMHLIEETLKKTKGVTDGDVFVEAAKGQQWMSPRGPVSIDPATRDIVQNIYIRKVERVGGKLQNVEFDKVADFKDPGKAGN